MKLEKSCLECGKLNAVLRYKTDPRTFREITRLLCTPCAHELGWVDRNTFLYLSEHARPKQTAWRLGGVHN